MSAVSLEVLLLESLLIFIGHLNIIACFETLREDFSSIPFAPQTQGALALLRGWNNFMRWSRDSRSFDRATWIEVAMYSRGFIPKGPNNHLTPLNTWFLSSSVARFDPQEKKNCRWACAGKIYWPYSHQLKNPSGEFVDALVRACSAASAKTSQKLKSQYPASKPSIHAALTMLLLLRRSDAFLWVSTPSSLAYKCITNPL